MSLTPRRIASCHAYAVSTVLLLLLSATLAVGQKETVLYSFRAAGGPSGQLVLDNTGALYGTTESGFLFGTVFKLAPPSTTGGSWTETELYDFKGDNHGIVDGATPLGGVTIDETGALYGTTSQGGVSNRGSVFKLAPPATSGGAWTETILHFFGGSQNGETPASSLLRVKSGALYGTTESGGASGAGTVFVLNPPPTGQTSWVERILYSFTGSSDGGTPIGGLILDSSGNPYGTTYGGGSGFGTIYQLSRPAVAGGAYTETVLYTFTGKDDGAKPVGNLVFSPAGALFGTASAGGTNNCGVVFELSPPSTVGNPWSYSVLHGFTGPLAGPGDGCDPLVGVTLAKSGVLYGTTYSGGYGNAFKLTPPVTSGGVWAETILYRFGATEFDAQNPYSPLLIHGGALYGTTQGGGSFGAGTVFELVP
jgi:uncharacterized repeat protein (TIGR03803 family)